MGLQSFFRRTPAPSASAEPTPRKRGKATAQAEHADQVQELRARARHRLIGAAVLVGLGVVAFPLVFETQPRPVPMDLPIVIPAQDAAPAVRITAPALPASLPDGAQAEAAEPTGPVEADPAALAPPPQPASKPKSAPAVVNKPADKPLELSAPKAVEKAVEKGAEKARFVVQVGAYADKASAQVARNKLEAKGLKTYAQVAQTKDGDRIRVRLGPFADRAEADKAAAQAKSAGLGGSVLTL